MWSPWFITNNWFVKPKIIFPINSGISKNLPKKFPQNSSFQQSFLTREENVVSSSPADYSSRMAVAASKNEFPYALLSENICWVFGSNRIVLCAAPRLQRFHHVNRLNLWSSENVLTPRQLLWYFSVYPKRPFKIPIPEFWQWDRQGGWATQYYLRLIE